MSCSNSGDQTILSYFVQNNSRLPGYKKIGDKCKCNDKAKTCKEVDGVKTATAIFDESTKSTACDHTGKCTSTYCLDYSNSTYTDTELLCPVLGDWEPQDVKILCPETDSGTCGGDDVDKKPGTIKVNCTYNSFDDLYKSQSSMDAFYKYFIPSNYTYSSNNAEQNIASFLHDQRETANGESDEYTVSFKYNDNNDATKSNVDIWFICTLPQYCQQQMTQDEDYPDDSTDNVANQCPMDKTTLFTGNPDYKDLINSDAKYKQCSYYYRSYPDTCTSCTSQDIKPTGSTVGGYCYDLFMADASYALEGDTDSSEYTGNIKQYQGYHESTVTSYCNNYPDAPDCACIKPEQYEEYNMYTDDTGTCSYSNTAECNVPYGCWWTPCVNATTDTSGRFLANWVSNVQDPNNMGVDCNCDFCGNIMCADDSDVNIDSNEQVVDCGSSGTVDGDYSSISSLTDPLCAPSQDECDYYANSATIQISVDKQYIIYGPGLWAYNPDLTNTLNTTAYIQSNGDVQNYQTYADETDSMTFIIQNPSDGVTNGSITCLLSWPLQDDGSYKGSYSITDTDADTYWTYEGYYDISNTFVYQGDQNIPMSTALNNFIDASNWNSYVFQFHFDKVSESIDYSDIDTSTSSDDDSDTESVSSDDSTSSTSSNDSDDDDDSDSVSTTVIVFVAILIIVIICIIVYCVNKNKKEKQKQEDEKKEQEKKQKESDMRQQVMIQKIMQQSGQQNSQQSGQKKKKSSKSKKETKK